MQGRLNVIEDIYIYLPSRYTNDKFRISICSLDYEGDKVLTMYKIGSNHNHTLYKSKEKVYLNNLANTLFFRGSVGDTILFYRMNTITNIDYNYVMSQFPSIVNHKTIDFSCIGEAIEVLSKMTKLKKDRVIHHTAIEIHVSTIK